MEAGIIKDSPQPVQIVDIHKIIEDAENKKPKVSAPILEDTKRIVSQLHSTMQKYKSDS